MQTVLFRAFLICAMLGLSACAKKKEEVSPETKALEVKDIYTCGEGLNPSTNKIVAKFWKNGVATPLTDGTKTSVAKAIVVVDRDVYIVGEETVNTYQVVKYWKNGVATT